MRRSLLLLAPLALLLHLVLLVLLVLSDASVPSALAAKGAYLLVLPRYFRGLRWSQSEELTAFLEFCKLLSVDLKGLGGMLPIPAGWQVEVVPLHPLMISQKGLPDYARRAPHPSVLVRLVKG
jgi:hypothetical protein